MIRRLCIAVSVLTLAACAAIPAIGPLEVIDTQVEANDEFVRVIAKPPVSGMSELDIVQGFITAISDASNDYAIARRYLAADVSAEWSPEKILVFDSASVEFRNLATNKVDVTGSAVGEITRFNRLRIYEQSQRFSYSFELADINSQKRIAERPEVTLISYGNLIRSYSGYSLYFVDDKLEFLSPEAIWLPDFSAGIESRLVRELLAGPKTQLKTAVPLDLNLEFDSVGYEDANLTVRLAYSNGGLSEAQRKLLLAQIVWTLTEIPDIDEVRVFLNSQPVRIQNSLALKRSLFNEFTQELPPIAQPLFVSAGDSLLRGDETGTSEVIQLAPLTSMSIAKDLSLVAGVRGQSAFVATGQTFQNPQQLARSVRSVIFDNRLRLWVLLQSGGLNVWLSSTKSTREVSLPDTRKIIALAPATDAARAALVIETPSGGQLRLSTINQQGSNLRLSEYRRVERFFTDIYSIDWVNTNELVILGRAGVEQPEVYVLNVTTGDIRRLGGPVGVVEVFARFDVPIYVVSEFGQYWAYIKNEWVLQGEAFTIALVG